MTARVLPAPFLALAFAASACSNAPVAAPGPNGKTFDEASFSERTCMTKLQAYLEKLDAKRMDSFFSAALSGLVVCEASSGLAHVPAGDVSRWLARANGRPMAGVSIPKAPASLSTVPTTDDERLQHQSACVSYMRRYIPASVARAGDDPDVAAAITFNALEECDSDSGFATIAPSALAAIMQAKHLL